MRPPKSKLRRAHLLKSASLASRAYPLSMLSRRRDMSGYAPLCARGHYQDAKEVSEVHGHIYGVFTGGVFIGARGVSVARGRRRPRSVHAQL